MRKDFEILEELFDAVGQLRQRTGRRPNRSYLSSSRKLLLELAEFSGKCQCGELSGRTRKRKSGELFRKIISLDPEVWST